MNYEKYFIHKKSLIGFECFKIIESEELLNFLNENQKETLTIEQNRIYIESSKRPNLVDTPLFAML